MISVTPDWSATAALYLRTVFCRSPTEVKSTASALGSCPRLAMQSCRRVVSTFCELTLAAATGSGGPLGRNQWLRMKNDLSFPPRLGLQLNCAVDVNVYGD